MNDLYENNVKFMYKNGHFLLKFQYFIYNFDVFKCIFVLLVSLFVFGYFMVGKGAGGKGFGKYNANLK